MPPSFVALVTLVAVGFQIYLARQEFDAVKRDLANNERLINDALRRANLHLTGVKTVYSSGNLNRQLIFSMRNDGDRQTNEMLVEVLIPQSAFMLGTYNVPARDVGKVSYFVCPFTPRTIHPNGVFIGIGEMPISARDFGAPIEMLWRAYGVNGRYPIVDYGKLSL